MEGSSDDTHPVSGVDIQDISKVRPPYVSKGGGGGPRLISGHSSEKVDHNADKIHFQQYKAGKSISMLRWNLFQSTKK